MLRRNADGTCPICHETECDELATRNNLIAFDPYGTPPEQVAKDRETKVTVTDRVWHGGFLAYTAGDRVDRFHADELHAPYATDEELREVSLDEYIKATENEDKRETAPTVIERPEPRPSKAPAGKPKPAAKKRPAGKGAETPSETS